MDNKELEKMIHEGGSHNPRKKPNHKYAWFSMLSNVNEPLECIVMLKNLNDAIDTLYELSDENYYLSYIWNASTILQGQLKDNGFTEEYFTDIAEQLELLRALLFGDNLDWNDLYQKLYDDALMHEAYWNKFHNERWHEAENKIKRLEKELEKENAD